MDKNDFDAGSKSFRLVSATGQENLAILQGNDSVAILEARELIFGPGENLPLAGLKSRLHCRSLSATQLSQLEQD